MKYIITSLTLIVLFTLSACNPSGKNNAQGIDLDSITENNELLFDTLSFHTIEHPIEGKETPSYSIDITALLPVGGSTLADSINKNLTALLFDIPSLFPKEAMQQYCQSLAARYNEEILDYYEPEEESYGLNYEMSLKCFPVEDSAEGIISFCFELTNYEGGAHGTYYTFYRNFRKSDGHLLTINEVYNGDPVPAMLQSLLDANNCRTREELSEKTGILMLGELYPIENFLLTQDEITFYFPIYDLAPYASGPTIVTIPWKKF